MDIVQVFSSQSEKQHSYHSDGKDTVNTQHNKTKIKTKGIKKYNQPIKDGEKVVQYQDNPNQYKRLRKKMQNRESAARVRGRKKDTYEHLEEEVDYLRRKNMELQLENARLQTDNKNLRGQVDYMKTLIKPSKIVNDPIDCFLSDDVLSHPSSQSQNQKSPSTMQEEEPVMFEEFDWMRAESSQSSVGWPFLGVFTIILAVFILPSTTGSSNVAAAFQTEGGSSTSSVPYLGLIFDYGIVLFKYLLVLGYSWLIFGKISAYLRGRKLKRG